jgi:hypothetical protein
MAASDPTCRRCLARRLRQRASETFSQRRRTYKSYDDLLVRTSSRALGKIGLAKMTPAEVQAFLNRKLDGGLSPRRVQYTPGRLSA